MDTLLVTTAIPFVNGAPHLGHALEYVQADVLARHARACGGSVLLLTGTDEHAAKNVQAAAAANRPVEEFVAANASRFRRLADALKVSYDDFIRTSADPRHRPVVEELWSRAGRSGDLYRSRYEGWYCTGCEEFRETACPEHDVALEPVAEENWFFRLSRYVPAIRARISDGRLRIEPPARRNEVLGFLAGEVRDLSVSRPRARVGEWGIPVPGDPGQLFYVWFDALANYVSAPGFSCWNEARTRTHVIGKGILRFHAVIWPAILLSAGLALPDEILVHDYLTASGRKIGKSLGNVVDPNALIERYGADALRWWLAREVPRLGETDFSEERLVATVNRDLAHGIGNLVQRVVALAARDDVRGAIPADDAWPLVVAGSEVGAEVERALAVLDLKRAAGAIIGLVAETNRYIERTKPWSLDAGDARPVVAAALHATTRVVDELEPFVPDLAARARARLVSLESGPPLVTIERGRSPRAGAR
ncbi:MAG: methionyl-tRNA synthetase [Actinomycetota bacterium]|jgi:methionyl-tRNA synthetase|nr:methionyl-tRNA synthetase [Actinomycetota bacterium]